jgi:predicted nucleic acid-binding protein
VVIYAETNYILELILKREEYSACEELLMLAEQKKVWLLLPSFSFAESYEALTRIHKARKAIHERLAIEVHELKRQATYKDEKPKSVMDEMCNILINSTLEESIALKDVISRVISISGVIDLTAETLQSAIDYENEYALSPQDAIVYASIIFHLNSVKPSSSCFLNRNSKDFNTPDIQKFLNSRSCKLFFSFKDGLGYIKNFFKD